MNTASLFRDFASRVNDSLDQLPELSSAQLNAHPLGHANSIAWLLWHSGREIDMQLSELSGKPEVWESGYREKLNLGPLGDTMGYGHTAKDAAKIRVDDATDLIAYVRACVQATIDYAETLDDAGWDEIVDRSWTPHVSRGTRLVSVIDDAVQHIAQVAYIAGMPELT